MHTFDPVINLTIHYQNIPYIVWGAFKVYTVYVRYVAVCVSENMCVYVCICVFVCLCVLFRRVQPKAAGTQFFWFMGQYVCVSVCLSLCVSTPEGINNHCEDIDNQWHNMVWYRPDAIG